MSYKLLEEASVSTVNNDGIKGTALIVSKVTSAGGSYPYANSMFHPIVETAPRMHALRGHWTMTDVTGDFDAILHNSDTLAFTNSPSNGAIRLEYNKKILLIGYMDAPSHTSSTNATFNFATTSYTGTNHSISGNDSTSNLTQHYAPSWKTYGNDYSEEIPSTLNNSDIGRYFKRAGIDKLNDNLMYSFMETGSSGNLFLSFKWTAKSGSPSYLSYNYSEATAHFVKVIQFI